MTKVALRTKLVLRQNQITWRIYKPFISLILEGEVSLVGDESSQKVNILRDTGATKCLSALQLTENSFTGTYFRDRNCLFRCPTP